jgi:glycosyltransferase involved in cell wall biosynthesis
MTTAVALEEPTQDSIRALLDDWTGGLWPQALVETGRDGEGREGVAAAYPRGVQPLGRPGMRAEGVAAAYPGAAQRAQAAGRTDLPKVAYVLPGLPPEGSGGSHSLVQEARGMRALGAQAWICVPEDALATATALYGGHDDLFVAYPEEEHVLPGVGGASVREAVADADVAVATEYPSVDLLAQLQRARPWLTCAYYVQDYEPLFARGQSSRADRALLSYRAHPDQLLFAKTRWLCDLVRVLHGVPVAKVTPSLDRALFHPGGRAAPAPAVRVAAMIRPRTPRRRPAATLEALALVAHELGDAVEIRTFGCDWESFAQLPGGADVCGVRHLGVLTRIEVANLMRRSDVFLDASAYQAFGRTGLEAMACGAVPLLPALGGVREYAVQEANALLLTDDSPPAIAQALNDLARDPDRLERLREAGMRAARDFSIERAARSQLDLFAAVRDR